VSGLVAKETRALLVPWLACMALLGAGVVSESRLAEPLSILVFIGGACALGAASLGHEYTAGTLASMLAQPVGRVRLLAVKTAVLAAMLTCLFAIFSAVPRFTADPMASVVGVAAISGLCLAPFFTILTRSALAGAVFGISLLGMIWVLLGLFTPQQFAEETFWQLAAMLGVAAVALTWREFLRLEAIDGRGTHVHVHMPWDKASAVSRVRHSAWAVVRKELGLQQIAFVLAAIYFVGAVRVVGHVSPTARDISGGLTVLYSGMLALLIGSVASAEERQLGTLEWQQLLPMATWKQWVLKSGTVIGLALLLGVALPAAVLLGTSGVLRIGGWYVAFVVLFAAIGLYVSSLSASSLRALLLSAALPLGAIAAMSMIRISPVQWSLTPIRVGLLAAFVALLLRLAFDNHRTADRSLRRTLVQLFILWGCAALELVVAALVMR
jgi:hypothetical protein